MTAITMESIGLSKEELQERVIEALCAGILTGTAYDPDSEREEFVDSRFKQKLDEKIKEYVDQAICALGDRHILPNVEQYIDNLTLQERTRWGEKKGEPVSFLEYLVSRADAYIREPVNHDGKTKAEDSYNWREHTTRLVYVMDRHLKYHIHTAMETALKDANQSIAGGITEAVKIALDRLQKGITATVNVKG